MREMLTFFCNNPECSMHGQFQGVWWEHRHHITGDTRYNTFYGYKVCKECGQKPILEEHMPDTQRYIAWAEEHNQLHRKYMAEGLTREQATEKCKPFDRSHSYWKEVFAS